MDGWNQKEKAASHAPRHTNHDGHVRIEGIHKLIVSDWKTNSRPKREDSRLDRERLRASYSLGAPMDPENHGSICGLEKPGTSFLRVATIRFGRNARFYELDASNGWLGGFPESHSVRCPAPLPEKPAERAMGITESA